MKPTLMKAPYFYSILLFLFAAIVLQAQDSNIQFYTPSKLMQSGQWDINGLTISTQRF